MKKHASQPGSVVYGLHAVHELLLHRPGEVLTLWVCAENGPPSPALSEVMASARQQGLSVQTVTKQEINRRTQNGVHQNIAASCLPFRYETDLLKPLQVAASRQQRPLLLLLDGVTDPQNLGALIRSASVLGAHGVVLPQDRSAQVTPTTIKAAAGATCVVPIVSVANLVRAVDAYKEAGLWLLAAVAPGQDGKPVWEHDLSVPLGVLLGGEESGLRKLVRKHSDLRAEIPMHAVLRGASLNVAAAGAILLYECMRQRQA